MKTTKKILTLILALALIFVLCAPAFAQVSTNLPTFGGDSNYEQTNLSDYYVNGEITVHLHVTTFKYPAGTTIDRVYDVTMGTANATNQLFTVKQVLEQADLDNSDIAFTIQSQYVTQTNTWAYYLTGVQDTQFNPYVSYDAAIFYGNSTPYVCGYMFRINGMIPYYTPSGATDAIGCLISDAYVTDNDTVDLYYMNVYKKYMSTRVEYINRVSYALDSNTNTYSATFQLMEAMCYKTDQQLDWTLTNWAKHLKSDDYTIYVDNVSTSVHLDSNGQFTLSGLSSGPHTFRFETTFRTLSTQMNGSTFYYIPDLAGMLSYFEFN